MKKLTMLLLACAMMALTNAAAVPEAEPEAVKEEPSVQEAAPEAEPVVEEPPAQEVIAEEVLETLAEESFLPKDLPEESEDMEMLEAMEEAAPEAEPVVEEPPAQEVIAEEVLETLAEESFLPKDLPEESEDMEEVLAMIKGLPDEVQKELAEGTFLTESKNLPEESEDMEMLEAMEEDDGLLQRSRLCRRGWSNYEQRCFIFFSTERTWAQAERHCRVLGGHLTSIHSYEEYRFIQQMIFRATNDYPSTWIGASDAQEEGVWLWSDGSDFSSTFWCRGEPNNLLFLQDCAQMNHGDTRCWADVHCRRRRPYVCATDL